MRFKIVWASLIVGSKFTVLSLFYFVFEGNFPSTRPQGAYIWRGDLTEGFLHYRFGGLIFGGAYTWMGLFLEFYGIFPGCCEYHPWLLFWKTRKIEPKELDQFRFVGNCPLTPPLSQHFALSEK